MKKELEKLYTQNPNLEEISMEAWELENLDDVFDIVSKFQNLHSLNLAQNQLKKLPSDLSLFKELQSINLKSNPNLDLENAVDSLSTLPNLQELNVDLYRPEDVERILDSLEELKILNGKVIDKSEDEEESENEEDEKEDNRDELSENEQNKKQKKSNEHEKSSEENELEEFEQLLKTETSTSPLQKKEKEISSQTKKSPQLKDTRRSSSTSDFSKPRKSTDSAKSEDKKKLSSPMKSFPHENETKIPKTATKAKPIKEEKHQNQCKKDHKLEGIAELAKIYDAVRILRKKTEPRKDAQLGREFETRMSKILTELKKNLLQTQIPNSKNALILKAKFEVLSLSFIKMAETTGKPSSTIWLAIKEGYDQIVMELTDLILVGNPLNLLESELNEAKRNLSVLQSKIDELTRETGALRVQLAESAKQLEEFQLENSSLEAENKKYFDIILKHSKAISNPPPKEEPSPQSSTAQSAFRLSPRDTPSRLKMLAKIPSQPRELTLKQLKEILADMFSQKSKYDEKCKQWRQPRETMEQYMYSYLNKRYGLKTLVIEWAAALIEGVRRHSGEDSEVALFGKVLQNECDEEYRLVHKEVRTAILQILRNKIGNRPRWKSEFNEIVEGKIEEKLWLSIIKMMYSEEDAVILEEKIRAKIPEKTAKLDPRKMTREEMDKHLLKKDNTKVYLKVHPPRDPCVPGPGTYNVRETPGKEALYSFRPRTVNPEIAQAAKRAPPPGAYEIISCISPSGSQFYSSYASSKASRFHPAHSARFVSRKSSVPGPGQYPVATTLSRDGKYVLSKHESSRCRTFGKGQRSTFQARSSSVCSPGPGSYQAPSEFGYYRANEKFVLEHSRVDQLRYTRASTCVGQKREKDNAFTITLRSARTSSTFVRDSAHSSPVAKKGASTFFPDN